MIEKILVLAYPGTGKTYLAENFENVSDLEFQHYRWNYGKYSNLPLEELKGRKDIRKNNPNWPDNFFEILNEELNKGRIVLVPMSTSIIEKLNGENVAGRGVRIILAIQTKNCLDALLKVFKKKRK